MYIYKGVANLKSAEISYVKPEQVKCQRRLVRVKLWLTATRERRNVQFPTSHRRLGQELCDLLQGGVGLKDN